MLTAHDLDILPAPILKLYEKYSQTVINDIARRIGNLNYSSASWQMQRLSEAGSLYEDILEKISELTGQSEQELHKIFEQAGGRAVKYDNAIYEAAGLKPLPLNLSPASLNVLVAGLNRTNGTLQNITRTTALTGQNAFIEATDLAYQQIITGSFDYNTAIRQAVNSVADEGLSVIYYPSGRKDQLDVAVRRAVLTGANQTAADITMVNADELGVDLVQTSAHIGARPSHEIWQGRVFSRSGTHPKYPDFVEGTGYGTVTGLCGINCRHSFYPYIEGLSSDSYPDLEPYKGEPVEYNGQELSQYEATQQQRAIERQIRKAKRRAEAVKEAGLDNSDELTRVMNLQAKMRDFTRQTGLSRQYVRESIGKPAKTNKIKSSLVPKPEPEGKFVLAKTVEEANQKLEKYLAGGTFTDYVNNKAVRLSGVHFEGIKKDQINSILRGVSDVSERFGVKFDYIGYQWRRRRSLGTYNYVYSGPSCALSLQKTWIRNAHEIQQRSINNWKTQLSRNIEQLKKAIADPKRSGLLTRNTEKLSILEKMKRWAIYSENGVDSLEATARHEAYHGVYYQKKLKQTFSDALKRNDVLRNQWYEVSEYGGSSVSELFAELGTALDMNIDVPDNLRRAIIETLESIL